MAKRNHKFDKKLSKWENLVSKNFQPNFSWNFFLRIETVQFNIVHLMTELIWFILGII